MKKQLRKDILQKRMAMTPQTIKTKSQSILNHIKALDLSPYRTIMIFMDFRQEVQTQPIIHYLLAKKKVIVLPKVNMTSKTMTLHTLTSLDDLELSDYGILEPKARPEISIEAIDYIFVPGLAFDKQGMRLGYGGGFYDSFLAQKSNDTPTTGLVFDFQCMASVPHEAHDQRVQALITEKGYLKCRP